MYAIFIYLYKFIEILILSLMINLLVFGHLMTNDVTLREVSPISPYICGSSDVYFRLELVDYEEVAHTAHRVCVYFRIKISLLKVQYRSWR